MCMDLNSFETGLYAPTFNATLLCVLYEMITNSTDLTELKTLYFVKYQFTFEIIMGKEKPAGKQQFSTHYFLPFKEKAHCLNYIYIRYVPHEKRFNA